MLRLFGHTHKLNECMRMKTYLFPNKWIFRFMFYFEEISLPIVNHDEFMVDGKLAIFHLSVCVYRAWDTMVANTVVCNVS